MCGLTGIFHPDRAGTIDAALLRRMTDAIRYRGPDGDGYHVEPGVGLGHRRLSIVDVAGGSQPMYNEDESVVIVFNGEIYNFPELRPKLQAMGHVFRNRCDTEAVIHAWESWGPDCLLHLNGMFAFALWDRRQATLFIARDRLGKKPLYYGYTTAGAFVFGSELAALAPVPDLTRRINAAAVDDFFALGYVPDPDTIYEGIRRLPAAHYLLLRRGADATPRRYWQPPTQAGSPIGEEEAIRELQTRLADSTQKRLMSDVPLGAFLSGGVDSSGVVATAARLQDDPLATFTIGFPGAEDERPLARLVSARYGTAQHEDEAVPDYFDAARRQARVFGEPFGDSSSVPTETVCELARRHVTVAISGDGGDEVFAGYRRYRFHKMAEAVRTYVPAGLRRGVLGQLAAAYPKMDWAPRWLRAKHTLTEISLDSALGFYRTLAKVHQSQRRALFSSRLRAQLDGHDPAARVVDLMQECDDADSLLQAQYVDVNLYLAGDILTKVDRTSMAHSLEVRAPFLDYEFVEWGMRLPQTLKLRGQEGKWVVKKALEKLVPSEILYRTKQGFAISLAPVFRQRAGELRVRLLGAHMLECGLFDPAALARMVDEHAAGRSDHSGALWLLLAFEGFLVQAETAAAPVAIAA
ncbi:MAG: amidotransferase 1, exosortase A system-associated [Acetobacteraceae bacterium]|nr:amidotransferase 1, exosortase A system-associated [Acetobacteraceae bacterium]